MSTSRSPSRLRGRGVHARLASGLAMLLPLAVMRVDATELRSELEQLAHENAFTVDGLDRVGSEDAVKPISADVPGQLRELLRNYNHLIIAGVTKPVERVVVLGQKHGTPGAPPDPAVTLTRDGAHHRVDAILTGPNGQSLPLSLILDTGASNVVLPESMIPDLGFRSKDLARSESQTASGTLPVRTGVLRSVTLGDHQADEVGVSFIPDQKLGKMYLLGMSFLGRYRFTIDDQKGELILMAK